MNNVLGLFSGLSDMIWQIALLVAVVVLIGYLLKYETGRIVIISVLAISFIAFTGYCGVQLNYYYNESGGIYGQIVNLYKPNEVIITDNVSYLFENIALTKDGDLYSAKISTNEVLDLVLDEQATYGVYVNGMPCNYVEITKDYVLAEYRYTFYDIDFNVLMDDTLSFKFAFYTNSTYLSVTTSGGAEAVKYWNNYFNKNVFEVTIDNQGYSYSNDITFGSGDISNYSVVTYYVDDEIYLKQIYKNGNSINLPSLKNYEWLVDDVVINSNFIVNESVDVYGQLLTGDLSINPNGGVWNSFTTIQTYSQEYGSTLIIDQPTRTGYLFNGWKFKGTGSFSNNTYTFGIETDTLIAQWTPITYTILYNANGGSGAMSNTLCTYDNPINLSTNSFINDGYVFAGWSTSVSGEVEYINAQIVQNLSTIQNDTVVLYAQWTNNYYTAFIYAMGTTGGYTASPNRQIQVLAVPEDVITLSDESNSLGIAIENGLVFDYATDSNGNVITTAIVSGDNSTAINFYFKRVQYTLTLNANGGDFEPTTGWTMEDNNVYSTRYYGQPYGTLPIPTKDGYSFLGWFTEEIGGNQVASYVTMSAGNTTLYAHWKSN